MNLVDAVISQLKAFAPEFGGNVAGAAMYANAVDDQGWLPRPAAYVFPGDQDAGENGSQTSLWQLVTERLAVIVDMDNSTDRRGQNSISQLEPMRAAVFRALLNWRPDWSPTQALDTRAARGFAYVSGEVVFMDRGRLHYQFMFSIERLITADDGWQIPRDPLTEIQGVLTAPSSPVQPIGTSFDVKPPQS